MPVKPDPQAPASAGRGRLGRPPVLSREAILTSALRIVDERGLEGLTMRRLGANLGVDPMAIYHHVPDKAALFDGLVERVFSMVAMPKPTGRWSDDVRATAQAVRRTFLAHPHAIPLLGTRPPVTESAFDVFEAVSGFLLDAGFTAQQAADGVDCAARVVIGHTLAEGGRPPGGEVNGGESEHLHAQQSLPGDRFPSLVAMEKADVRHDPERLFELALDGLVLVLERQHIHGA
jgi:TetR/AcrR family transcriptional regulator, tetracycline repressor protein